MESTKISKQMVRDWEKLTYSSIFSEPIIARWEAKHRSRIKELVTEQLYSEYKSKPEEKMSISGTQDDKSIRRKPLDPQNNKNSSLKTRENTNPKKMSYGQISMAGNSRRSNIYKKK